MWRQAEDSGAESQEAAPEVSGTLPGWDPKLHCAGSAPPKRFVLPAIGSCPTGSHLDFKPVEPDDL